MYNPVDVLLNNKSSRDEIKLTADIAIEGINAIADVFYCADVGAIDQKSVAGLGAALLVLNGIINTSIEKMEKLTNE